MPTDPLDLDAIEMRAASATRGPWYPWNRGVGWHIATKPPTDGRIPPILPEGSRTDIGRAEDAAFMAAAREDVPALVAEARRLRARVAELETENAAVDQGRPEALDQLLAAVAQALPGQTPEERADWAERNYRRAHRVAVRATRRVEELAGTLADTRAKAQHILTRAEEAEASAAEWESRFMRHGNKILAMTRDEKALLEKLVAAEAQVATATSALRDILARLRRTADGTEPGMASGIIAAVEWVTEALAQADVYLDAAGTPAPTSDQPDRLEPGPEVTSAVTDAMVQAVTDAAEQTGGFAHDSDRGEREQLVRAALEAALTPAAEPDTSTAGQP